MTPNSSTPHEAYFLILLIQYQKYGIYLKQACCCYVNCHLY